MDSNREHPLYYLDAETLLVAIYVWVGHGRRYMQHPLSQPFPEPLHGSHHRPPQLLYASVVPPGHQEPLHPPPDTFHRVQMGAVPRQVGHLQPPCPPPLHRLPKPPGPVKGRVVQEHHPPHPLPRHLPAQPLQAASGHRGGAGGDGQGGSSWRASVVAWAVGWFGGRASYPCLRKRGGEIGARRAGAGLHGVLG
jgi:hypothetical protein